jgi:hypothetical protein
MAADTSAAYVACEAISLNYWNNNGGNLPQGWYPQSSSYGTSTTSPLTTAPVTTTAAPTTSTTTVAPTTSTTTSAPSTTACCLAWPTVTTGFVRAHTYVDPNWYGNSSDTYSGHKGMDVLFHASANSTCCNNPDQGVWDDMNNNPVSVYAACDGIVSGVEDGYEDECDSNNPSDPVHGEGGTNCAGQNYPNYVKIDHGAATFTAHGYRYTEYLHLQKGSIPANLAVGDTVTKGQEIGKIGSSGRSSWPHLHFSAWDDAYVAVDPFLGVPPYGSNSTASMWCDQCNLPIHFGAGTSAATYPLPPGPGGPPCTTVTPTTTAAPTTSTTTAPGANTCWGCYKTYTLASGAAGYYEYYWGDSVGTGIQDKCNLKATQPNGLAPGGWTATQLGDPNGPPWSILSIQTRPNHLCGAPPTTTTTSTTTTTCEPWSGAFMQMNSAGECECPCCPCPDYFKPCVTTTSTTTTTLEPCNECGGYSSRCGNPSNAIGSTITPGVTWAQTTGALSGANDTHVYALTLTAGKSYSFSTGQCNGEGTSITNYDSFLCLYNSSNVNVASNDDSVGNCSNPSPIGNLDSYIDCYQVQASGTYYIVVSGFGGAFGDYTLSWKECSTATTTTAAPATWNCTNKLQATGTFCREVPRPYGIAGSNTTVPGEYSTLAACTAALSAGNCGCVYTASPWGDMGPSVGMPICTTTTSTTAAPATTTTTPGPAGGGSDILVQVCGTSGSAGVYPCDSNIGTVAVGDVVSFDYPDCGTVTSITAIMAPMYTITSSAYSDCNDCASDVP